MRGRFKRSALRTAAACAAFLLLFGAAAAQRNQAREALRYVVNNLCVPGQLQNRVSSPCNEVDISGGVDRGYAILKNIFGTSHYLLIATGQLSGIESPALLAPDAPNYFAEAWEARSYVFEALGRTLPRDGVGLAINSTASRSQDQMHIHMDCMRADVSAELRRHNVEIGDRWAPLKFPLAGGHRYTAMWVPGEQLGANNPFKLLAEGIPGATQNMGERTLVVVGASRADGTPGFVILTNQVDRKRGELAHGEELQDHRCRIATPKEPLNKSSIPLWYR